MWKHRPNRRNHTGQSISIHTSQVTMGEETGQKTADTNWENETREVKSNTNHRTGVNHPPPAQRN